MNTRSKTAIVTGASSGIGYDVARACLELGWNVVMNGRDAAKLELAAAQLGARSQLALVVGDIGRPGIAEQLAHIARREFGGADVLVNNAGMFGTKSFLEVTENDLDRYIGGNLKGTYFVSQAFVRQLKQERRAGAIVNIGTVLVEHAMHDTPASAALITKGGVHTLTVNLAAELAPDRIRVNAVAPGFIRTPLMDGADDRQLAKAALVGRIGSVREISEAVLYLAEAEYVTGHILRVDGGYVTGRR